jgi:two-component sensor histidine kinase
MILLGRTAYSGAQVERRVVGFWVRRRYRVVLAGSAVVMSRSVGRTLRELDFQHRSVFRLQRHEATRAIAELLQQKEVLLQEMQHRIGNSLQIIASILLLKARAVQSEETRMHLQDAHTRVMSVAAVQQQLLASGKRGQIELAPYVMRLCDTLAASMISESRGISLKVDIEPSTVSSTEAISIGLVVTELVINALKHAFPADRPAGLIVVSYEVDETNWRLSVSDNGVGRSEACLDGATPGLGTSIVQALARQLDGRMQISPALPGTSVSITHGRFSSGSEECFIPVFSRPPDVTLPSWQVA